MVKKTKAPALRFRYNALRNRMIRGEGSPQKRGVCTNVRTQTWLYLASGGVGRRTTLPLRGTVRAPEVYWGPSALRVPYLLRCCLRPWTPPASRAPRMMW